MSRMIALKSLLEALAGSLVGAQSGIDWMQLRTLREFLHRDATPKTMNFVLPTPGSEEPAFTEYQAPLLSLVAPQILGIRHAELDFQVGLGDVEFEARSEMPARMLFMDLRKDGPLSELRTPKDILVDTSAPGGKGSPGLINIKLRLRAVEPADGYTRLLTLLSQQQGARFDPPENGGEGRDRDESAGRDAAPRAAKPE